MNRREDAEDRGFDPQDDTLDARTLRAYQGQPGPLTDALERVIAREHEEQSMSEPRTPSPEVGTCTTPVMEHTIRYQIECWRQSCVEHGCLDHPVPGWYPSKAFRGVLADPNTSAEYAEVLLRRAQAEAPRANYRLVEVEEHHKVVHTVVAA